MAPKCSIFNKWLNWIEDNFCEFKSRIFFISISLKIQFSAWKIVRKRAGKVAWQSLKFEELGYWLKSAAKEAITELDWVMAISFETKVEKMAAKGNACSRFCVKKCMNIGNFLVKSITYALLLLIVTCPLAKTQNWHLSPYSLLAMVKLPQTTSKRVLMKYSQAQTSQ